MIRTRIIIFAKAPRPGRVKTRLIPALGAQGAARLALDMLRSTVEEAFAARMATPELCADPHPLDPAWQGLLPARPMRVTAQGEGSLGERLERAAKRTLQLGENVLLIGTDCPALDRTRLRSAAADLEHHDAVLHPTQDGGYALLGLSRFDPSIFAGIAWSTDRVTAQTLARIEALGWRVRIGDTLQDIDEPGDLAAAGRALPGRSNGDADLPSHGPDVNPFGPS
jgi:rSAM/selenodomain-associated transferase 1